MHYKNERGESNEEGVEICPHTSSQPMTVFVMFPGVSATITTTQTNPQPPGAKMPSAF